MSASRRAAGVAGGLLALGVVLWAMPRADAPRVAVPKAKASAESSEVAAPDPPSEFIWLHLGHPLASSLRTMPRAEGTPVVLQELEERGVGRPDLRFMGAAVDWGVDPGWAGWAFTGWSPWTDFWAVRGALAWSQAHPEDPAALALYDDLYDEATERWPSLDASWRALDLGRSVVPGGGGLDEVRATLDEAREADDRGQVAQSAAALLCSEGVAPGPRTYADQERLLWLADGATPISYALVACGLSMAVQHTGSHAEAWLALWGELPPDSGRWQRNDLERRRWEVVAAGLAPPVTWQDELVAAAGQCRAPAVVPAEGYLVSSGGRWWPTPPESILVQTPDGGFEPGPSPDYSEALVGCLLGLDLPHPPVPTSLFVFIDE